MYDLKRIQEEFYEICEKAGVENVRNIPISINGRLTRTLGRVVQTFDSELLRYISTKVEFSRQLIETSTDGSIRDVIMHEAAHLIVTYRTGEVHKHDLQFKQVCAEIGTKNDKAQTHVERTVEAKEIYKYTVYCPHCNKIVAGYSRMCFTLKNIDRCYCKICGGHDLKVTQNW